MALKFHEPAEEQPQSPPGLPGEEGAGLEQPMDDRTPIEFDELGFPMRNYNSEERRADLARDFEMLDRRNNQLKTKDAHFDQQLEEVRGALIREVFKMMEEMGVNPADIESVRQFLGRLEDTDPDIAALFESAISGLDGGGDVQTPDEPENPANFEMGDPSEDEAQPIPGPVMDMQMPTEGYDS